MPLPPDVIESLRALASALLIGFLVGAERETSQGEGHPGVRDFILIALIGAICALLQSPWLTVVALLSVAALLAVFRFHAPERKGITTEMAAVTTFCLGVLTATPGYAPGKQLAVGVTIVMVFLLEAKRSLHRLIRETITEEEFNDTLRFLAVIFIIYPLLPEGEFGSFRFLAPRMVWLFVILVSSISYLGYFLQKFLGARKGLQYAGVVGGLASSTAATLEFSRRRAEEPDRAGLYLEAAVTANAVQFLRVLAILYVVNRTLAARMALPLAVTGAAGLLLGWLVHRRHEPSPEPGGMEVRNPFRLVPALKFGAVFTAVLFLTKAAQATLGPAALYWASAIGSTLNVDAVVVSLSDVAGREAGALEAAALGVVLALAVNAVVKTGMAVYAGSVGFGARVAASFVVMFGAGAAAWWAAARAIQ